MLLPLTPRCCRHHHAAAALPNALPLLPKLCFCQVAASTTKLAATAALLLPQPLLPRCHHHATTAYKIKEKYVILLTYLIFHHDGNGSKQQ
jgi:hypothetical protein